MGSIGNPTPILRFLADNQSEILEMVDGYAFKPFSEKQFKEVVQKILAS